MDQQLNYIWIMQLQNLLQQHKQQLVQKSGTTSKVEEAFGNKANTGIYSDSDIVMFSANGNRRKDKTSVVQEENGVITLTDEYENIQKAVNAGAHIVNDSDQHLANTNSKIWKL